MRCRLDILRISTTHLECRNLFREGSLFYLGCLPDAGRAAKITASSDALRALQELFANENSNGPAEASHFVLGNAGPQEPKDVKFRRASIRQEMVEVARKLLESRKTLLTILMRGIKYPEGFPIFLQST